MCPLFVLLRVITISMIEMPNTHCEREMSSAIVKDLRLEDKDLWSEDKDLKFEDKDKDL